MTLIEVMVATALAGILSGSLLMMVRSQLIAYETNDQVNRAQQNARVATDLLESMARRACGGLAAGWVGLNVGTPSVQPCLRVWDGVAAVVQSAPSFSSGSNASGAADAVEIIFATSPFSKLTAVPNLGATPPTAALADVSGFAPNDLVLIGDMQTGVLLKVASGGVPAGGPPTAGTLTFVPPGGTLAVPSNPALNLGSTSLYAMKARSYALYVETQGFNANMLMLDPDGMIGTDHTDAQPLADGVIDLQVAVGIDSNSDGIITDNNPDEWYGNVVGETVPQPSWNRSGSSDPQLRQLRLTLVAQTLNKYPGVAPTLGPFEDRTTYPATTSTNGGPRYRSERVVVAPRVWNLLN
jgi:hypothetical protein